VTVNYTNIDAETAGIEIYQPLEEIGNDMLSPGQYALGLDGDTVVFVVGTIEQLGAFTMQLAVAYEAAKGMWLGPMKVSDFALDVDHDYACPRCEAVFDPSSYPTFGGLAEALLAHTMDHNTRINGSTIEDI
jgi:hypothetical protein